MDKNLTLEKLLEEQKKTNLRIDILQRTIETLDDDRQILENVVGRLTSLEEQVRLARQNDSSVSKDIKQEVRVIGDKVENVVKTEVESIRNIAKKNGNKRSGFFKRLFKRG